MTDKSNLRLVAVDLDEASIVPRGPDVEHERKIAIFDLLEQNYFAPVGAKKGPFKLRLAIEENRLVFDISDEDDRPRVKHILSLTPLKRVMRDYFVVCDSYYQAIRSASPSQIEAIDMGRRGLHNEGSQALMDRLAGKIEVDLDTARRLFTLICALHTKA
ncbi:MAG: UPF0262 family protein [Alphaproteobacteria bacterium]|nr:UPF0262 family protein [Alphaproteobacteria bacterium]